MFKSLPLVALLENRHSELSGSLLLNWCLVLPQGDPMSMKEKDGLDKSYKKVENSGKIK